MRTDKMLFIVGFAAGIAIGMVLYQWLLFGLAKSFICSL